MKLSSRKVSKRVATKLTEATDYRLKAYELAATTAGVGMLALLPAATAEVVYTPAHQQITLGTSFPLDLNRDGVIDFTINNRHAGDLGSWKLSVLPLVGNGASGFRHFSTLHGFGSSVFASALRDGAIIGTRFYFPAKTMEEFIYTFFHSGFEEGSWLNVKSRYLGLKFKIDGETHYGWARLSTQYMYPNLSALLTGYAYETIANRPIIAGKTSGKDLSIETRSLGALAAGVNGLPAERVQTLPASGEVVAH